MVNIDSVRVLVLSEEEFGCWSKTYDSDISQIDRLNALRIKDSIENADIVYIIDSGGYIKTHKVRLNGKPMIIWDKRI